MSKMEANTSQPTTKKQPQVDNQLDVMQSGMSRLNDLISELSERLLLVLRELDPKEEVAKKQAENFVPLACTLFERNCNLDVMCERMMDIIGRLEI